MRSQPQPPTGQSMLDRVSEDYLPALGQGLVVTLELTVLGILVTLVIGLVVGLLRTAWNPALRGGARGFLEFFRGTSLLVQLFWLYFVFNEILADTIGFQLDKVGAGVLALGLCYGAYASENVRGSIQAVPKAQWEATTALNMTPAVRMRRVIFPQAVTLMIGPFSVTMVELLKGTSLVSLIALSDMTLESMLQRNQHPTEAFVIFGMLIVIYYVLARLMTFGMRRLERRSKAWMGGMAGAGGGAS
jgi:polar amino acid transport system permease protein